MIVTHLLERDAYLSTLGRVLDQVAQGSGRIALVSGEAGIGKTSLVECFLGQQPRSTRILWGACQALFTPRPLGPLYDLASQTHHPLERKPSGRPWIFSKSSAPDRPRSWQGDDCGPRVCGAYPVDLEPPRAPILWG